MHGWLRRQVPGIRLQDTHETALRRIERMGREAWNERFSFTFIRNPWDRLVSWYHVNDFVNVKPSEIDSFDEWVRAGLPIIHKEFDRFFSDTDTRNYLDQDAFFCDLEGNEMVDFVGRFERLQEDWPTVCERLGIVISSLPHANRGEHKPYREYYTPETKKIVADRFGDLIERYKYQF